MHLYFQKPRLLLEDNGLEVDRKPNIYANDENPFQMDVCADACNDYDPSDAFSRTNTLPPKQPPSQEPEYDSEDEYANYMTSLNISDESKVSLSSVDARILKLPFQWKPIPANNKAEDLSRVDIEVEPSRPPELRPLRPKYFAVHYPVTPIDSYFKDSDKFFWAKVRYG